MINENILKAVAVTAELTGTELSAAALELMTDELDIYGESLVLPALTRCRKELKTKLTLSAVIERIETADGRPQADEAWTTAMQAQDESATVVWTTETQQAFYIAQPALEINDKTGARMAFKAAYERLVNDARATKKPIEWQASLGWDVESRRIALEAAVTVGKLPASQASGLLPAPINHNFTNQILQLASINGVADKNVVSKEYARKKLAEIRALLAKEA